VTDYATLQADVAGWTARGDLGTMAQSFIRLAEAHIGRVVRVLEQETDTTLSCTSPLFSATLPAGFLGFKHVFVQGANDPNAQYLTPQQFHEINLQPRNAFSQASGSGLIYTIEGNAIKIDQPVGSTDPVTLDVSYVKRFDALSDLNTTNWLLANHYDAYLFAALIEAWDWIDETEMVARYQSRFERVIGQLETQEKRKRMPSGPLVVRPPEVIF
jgi:hypothetical protein